jgi:hypothetical protein
MVYTLSAILPKHAHATHRMQAIEQHDEQQHEESLEAALALALEESIEDVEEASDASREQAARAPTGPSLPSAATAAAKDDGMDVKPSPSMPSAFNILPDVRANNQIVNEDAAHGAVNDLGMLGISPSPSSLLPLFSPSYLLTCYTPNTGHPLPFAHLCGNDSWWQGLQTVGEDQGFR